MNELHHALHADPEFDPNPDDGYTANEPSELIEPFEHLPFEPDAILVPIVRRAGYRLDGRANQSQSVVLADGVDTAWWSSAALVVIIHAKSGSRARSQRPSPSASG